MRPDYQQVRPFSPGIIAALLAVLVMIALIYLVAKGGPAGSVGAETTPTPAAAVQASDLTAPPTPSLQATPTLASNPAPAAAPQDVGIAAPPEVASEFPRPVDEAEVERLLARLTLEQKLGQMLMVGLPGPTVDSNARRRVVDQGVGGVIFLERNLQGPQQVFDLTQALQAAAINEGPGLPLFIGWNHEGGDVVRRGSGLTRFPSNMALGAANQPDLVYQIGLAVATEMRSVGVNVNYAPVLDVNTDPANPIIGLRSYGDDPTLVAELGRRYIQGQQDGGVITVAKHFPGHGGVNVDSHLQLPLLSAPLPALQQVELPPFQAALTAGVDAVMIAHLSIPALASDGRPSSLSPEVVDNLLRQQLGYDGVVMTDDLGMGAIVNQYNIGEAAVLAVLAGNDLLLSVETESQPEVILQALRTAVASGRLPEERVNASVRRLIRLKVAYGLHEPPSPPLLAGQEAHQALALAAGRAAVRVEQDTANWLPLNLPDRQLLLVSPTKFNAGSVTGDNRSLLGERLAAAGITVTERFYEPEVPADIAQVQAQALSLAAAADAVVVVTWDAALRYAQRQEVAQETLVNSLLATGKPVVAVFGHLPYDRERVPQAPAQVTLFGDGPGQVEGLVALLLGTGGEAP